MATKKGNRVQIAAYLDEAVYGDLSGLSKDTRVPVAAYVREAIEDLLAKYEWKRTRIPGAPGNQHRLVKKATRKKS